MKKYINLLTILLLTACAAPVNKTAFVNPIFNQRLRALSSGTGDTYITPTSVDMRGRKDKNLTILKGDCELVENTQERITLKCKYKWIPPKGSLEDAQKKLNSPNKITREIAQDTIYMHTTTFEKYFTYKIDELFFDTCLTIEETIYNKKQGYIDKSGTYYYCVTPPDDYKSKAD